MQVVSAPVIGKVAQVGIERVLGTVIGGWTGYAVYMLGSRFWNETTDGEVPCPPNAHRIFQQCVRHPLILPISTIQCCIGSNIGAKLCAGIVLSVGAAAVAYISCEAAQRLKLADRAKLFALTFLLVTFGAQDGISTSMIYLATTAHMHIVHDFLNTSSENMCASWLHLCTCKLFFLLQCVRDCHQYQLFLLHMLCNGKPIL